MSAPAPSRLVLHGNTMWTSPYVLSVFVALKEKGLPFEMELVALHEGAHRSAAYRGHVADGAGPDAGRRRLHAVRVERHRRVPRGQVASAGAPAPAPRDLAARARARQLMAWIRSDLMPIREERSAEVVFYPRESLPPWAPLSTAARRSLREAGQRRHPRHPRRRRLAVRRLVHRRHRPRDDAAAAGEDRRAAPEPAARLRRARVAAPRGAGLRERAPPAPPPRARVVTGLARRATRKARDALRPARGKDCGGRVVRSSFRVPPTANTRRAFLPLAFLGGPHVVPQQAPRPGARTLALAVSWPARPGSCSGCSPPERSRAAARQRMATAREPADRARGRAGAPARPVAPGRRRLTRRRRRTGVAGSPGVEAHPASRERPAPPGRPARRAAPAPPARPGAGAAAGSTGTAVAPRRAAAAAPPAAPAPPVAPRRAVAAARPAAPAPGGAAAGTSGKGGGAAGSTRGWWRGWMREASPSATRSSQAQSVRRQAPRIGRW